MTRRHDAGDAVVPVQRPIAPIYSVYSSASAQQLRALPTAALGICAKPVPRSEAFALARQPELQLYGGKLVGGAGSEAATPLTRRSALSA